MTGGVAAGKSEALAAFGRLGAATVSADTVVHELLDREPLLGRLVERWGPEVAPGGRVDRAAVGSRVFTDRDELAWLESQIHPLVRERLAEWITELPPETEVAVVEVPLLFEGEMHHGFDATVAVVASEEIRRERAASRGHVELEGRDARQLSQAQKAERATFVVENDGTREELQERLAGVLAELRG